MSDSKKLTTNPNLTNARLLAIRHAVKEAIDEYKTINPKLIANAVPREIAQLRRACLTSHLRHKLKTLEGVEIKEHRGITMIILDGVCLLHIKKVGLGLVSTIPKLLTPSRQLSLKLEGEDGTPLKPLSEMDQFVLGYKTDKAGFIQDVHIIDQPASDVKDAMLIFDSNLFELSSETADTLPAPVQITPYITPKTTFTPKAKNGD